MRVVLTITVLLASILLAIPCRGASLYSSPVPTLPKPPLMKGTIDNSWSSAARIPISFDFTYQRTGEPTDVYIAQDSAALDIAFRVEQKRPLIATQETNGPGVLNDDHVIVYLWPEGTQGFAYAFMANALGARYQTSSENTAYSPEWTATARRTLFGYIVTMRIPFSVIRSAGSHNWHAQFARITAADNGEEVWAHARTQRTASEEAFSGVLTGIQSIHKTEAMHKNQARVQMYALGEMASPSAGGSTSRLGVDLSVPVTQTSSFVATLHPDYSDVEIDQQTIAPTAFARQYSEVRPFFTQTTPNFNEHTGCTNCPITLYSPSIPAFKDGYAYEGAAGPVSFAMFNADGYQRDDNAQTLNYNISSPAYSYGANLQRVAMTEAGLVDTTTTLDAGYENRLSHLVAYINTGGDRGSNVQDPNSGNYIEYGTGYTSRTTSAVFTMQDIGAQFNPIDGYVQQSDINGYIFVGQHTKVFSKSTVIQDITGILAEGRYNDHKGNLAQTDAQGEINLDFRDQLSAHILTSSNGVRTVAGEYLPFNDNGFFLGYKTQTSTPTRIEYDAGAYYHGNLRSWSYATTLPVAHSVTLSLEADENYYASSILGEPFSKQWLERGSVDWQISRYASLDIGIRRIIGRNLPNAFQVPDDITPSSPFGEYNGPNPFDFVDASNASTAFHFLVGHNEIYAAYGDPNSLATSPTFILKWIRYVGADKGT